MLSLGTTYAQTSRKLMNNPDGFQFYLLDADGILAVQNKDGDYIIPFNKAYKTIEYNSDYGYFNVATGEYGMGAVGVCDKWGKTIIEPNKQYRMIAYSKKDGFNYFAEGYPSFGIFLDTNHKAYKIGSSGQKQYLSDVPPATLLARGIYTESSQGYCMATGQYTGYLGSDFTVDVEFYEDYIKVLGTEYYYKGDSNGWKKYVGGTMSFNNSSSVTAYYVDKNYNMRKIMTSTMSFMGQTNTMDFSYTVSKGEVTIPKFNNNPSMNGGNVLGATNNSSNYNHSNSTNTNRSSKGKTCHICHGTKKCWTCGGNRTYINPLTNKRVACPNCTNGWCSRCNGTGKL